MQLHCKCLSIIAPWTIVTKDHWPKRASQRPGGSKICPDTNANRPCYSKINFERFYFTDIARNWDLSVSRIGKLNPANPENLLCDISGRPEPSYTWTSNMTDSLPSHGNTLSFQRNSRQNGDIELVTCEGIVGEF